MCHMLSTCVQTMNQVVNLICLYLNHGDFRRKKHADKVLELMSEKVEGLEVPTPRPTRAHMLDFNLNFCGTHLIDGECKDKAGDAEMGVLVLHSLDQLAYKEVAHSMMTTNNSFTIVQASKNMLTNRIETRLTDMPKFKFGAVKSLNPQDDPEAKNEDLQFPPPYTLLEVRFWCKTYVWRWSRNNESMECHEVRTEVLPEVPYHYMIDHICGLVSDMPVKLIRQRHESAYTAGWMEHMLCGNK